MRIVDVCAFYSPTGGGVRTYIEAKLRAAARLGHELIIIAPGAREEIIERGPGAVIATIPSPVLPLDRSYRYFHDRKMLHRVLDAWRPDHVEVSSPWLSAEMVGCWQGAATRSLVMHCDPLAAYAYRWLGSLAEISTIDRWFGWFWHRLRRLDGMFDPIVCANRGLADRLRAGGVGNAVTIPMGVEEGIFSPTLRTPELRAEVLGSLGLDPAVPLLIGVGRFSAEKRWDMVIRAAAECARTRPLGFALVGDGPRRRQLKRLAGRFGNCAVLPPIENRGELARFMASADGLVHGGEAETFCMVAAEARASGIPLIVPDRGGAADQVLRGAGLAYAAASRRSLTHALEAFIAHGVELQRARAAHQCSVRGMSAHFEDLFEHYGRLARRRPEREAAKVATALAIARSG